MWPWRPSGGKVKTRALSNTCRIWFCLSNAGEFSFWGLTASPLGSKPRRSLRKGVLCVRACSLHSPPPVGKWPLFKNTQNALIFRVVHMTFTARFVKNSDLSLKGLFFASKEKNLKNKTSHLWKNNCFFPFTCWWGYSYPLIIRSSKTFTSTLSQRISNNQEEILVLQQQVKQKRNGSRTA